MLGERQRAVPVSQAKNYEIWKDERTDVVIIKQRCAGGEETLCGNDEEKGT